MRWFPLGPNSEDLRDDSGVVLVTVSRRGDNRYEASWWINDGLDGYRRGEYFSMDDAKRSVAMVVASLPAADHGAGECVTRQELWWSISAVIFSALAMWRLYVLVLSLIGG